jgi:hypothetical protein
MPITVQAAPVSTLEQFEDALKAGTRRIFSSMFGEEVRCVRSLTPETPDISRVIAFTGRVSGYRCVHMKAAVACEIASTLVGFQFSLAVFEVFAVQPFTYGAVYNSVPSSQQ